MYYIVLLHRILAHCYTAARCRLLAAARVVAHVRAEHDVCRHPGFLAAKQLLALSDTSHRRRYACPFDSEEPF